MPHINRIRVNNVKYNFGTQFYDDFIMRFSCRNTIYDLANGGGKSVLMLLLLQNLIPNCTLDEKQPIEKLFRTSEGSKTIHSLIEWRLSDIHVKNNYKYMLTGFCARKAKDDVAQETETEETAGQNVKENASIEYFNYVIFYREFNDNDIKNLPLSNGNERITYNGLKAYLRELEKKDLSLEVRIFDRKGDYQRFISQYGLYESEWEIIRGINKTEGHVRTYFETNYKTTRKVVEDLLIEEIIQKSFMNQTESSGEDDYMAKTLLDIKDKLLELSAKKEDILSFDRQIEVIDGFASRVQSVKQLYFGREDITEDIRKCYGALQYMMSKDDENREKLAERETSLLDSGNEIESLIEGAKISGSESLAAELGNEIEELISEQGIAAVALKNLGEELTLKESINDYADYVYYKNQRDELRELIDACLKDKGQLLAEVTELTGQVSDRMKRQKQYIDSEIEKEEKILDMEKALQNELAENIGNLNNDIAVAEYLLKEYEDSENRLNSSISAMKNALELYMVTDISGRIEESRLKCKEAGENFEKNEETLKLLTEKKGQLELAIHDMKSEMDNAGRDLSDNIDLRTKFGEVQNRAARLMEIYGERDPKALAESIRIRNREAVLEEEALANTLARKKGYLERLKTGCPVGTGEDVQKVIDYIERYHGAKVISGADYIKTKDSEERQQLLYRIPLLPYSVVALEDYMTIAGDAGLKELELGDHAVPVISVNAIDKGTDIIDNMSMMFVMKDESLFTDGKALERETAKTAKDIEDTEFRIESISGKVKVLQEDYDFAREYETVYITQINEASENYEKLRYAIKELEAGLEEKEKELKETEKSLEEHCETRRLLEESIRAGEKEAKELEELRCLMGEAEKISAKLSEAGAMLKKSRKEKGDLEARYEAGKNQAGERLKRIESLKNQSRDNETRFAGYRKYYKEGNYPESPMGDDELESRLKGLIGALERDNTDLSDKQKLMENYDVAMEKSLQAIDYKGLSVEDVKAKYESFAASESTKEELLKLKQDIETAKCRVDSFALNIAKLKSKKDRLEGAIVHGKEAMAQKYGEYREVKVENGDYESFIEEKKSQADAVAAELQTVREEISVMQKNSGKYAILEKDITKVLERAGIAVTEQMTEEAKNDYVISEAEFEERISRAIERFEKYTRDISDKKSEFEHDRQLLADTLRKLGAETLSEEIKNSAVMPSNIRETDELMDALKDICKCLELERDRVSRSIDDMEKIKDNFENQCIQTCVNIKNELDRLPKQSKIFMDNETISIISLTVPYVKEEQYKFRMSQYIDETTRTADEMKSEAERIKYIKSRLSWKKLFSVIVTDMNAIRLNLYKRERIKEQSRYLKYEEAVGSTGQSQGIYIQFLIAVINYISAINSRDKDVGLRKVIFIDNPFGAAKDIYIWEPIFKLLKTNNVQLIVPARGVTPAITGRFDVNYILGQKLVGGRQQTVVVDYSSHVDNEKMDYSKLEFEQTSLF